MLRYANANKRPHQQQIIHILRIYTTDCKHILKKMHWTACCIDPWFMWMWCNSSHLVGWINMNSITVLLCLWTHQQYNYQLWLQFKCNNSSTVCIDCTWWPDDNSSFLKTRLPRCNVNLTNTMATTTCEASAALSSNCQRCFQPSVCVERTMPRNN